MTLNVLLLAPTNDQLSTLSGSVPHLSADALQLSSQLGGVAELNAWILREEFDIVVADLPVLNDNELAALGSTLASRPNTSLILVCHSSASDFLLRAMRAGIREVVPPEDGDGGLTRAFERQLERVSAAKGPVRKARMIAFLSAKGGGGATFLATNLGFALADRGRRVALFDLNLQFGDAALFVSDQRPLRTIAEVAREINRLDGAFLEANMMKPQEGYFVLPAPDSPERAIDVQPETIEKVFALARSRYDFVIVDVGRVLDRVTVSALDEVDTIYIVIQSTLPYLHNAKRLITVLGSLGYDRDKVKIILNRYVKGDEIGVSEIEKALGLKVEVQIPNSYVAVAYSINHGLSLLKQSPRDPVASTLSEIAEGMAPNEVKRPRGGFLRGLFRS